MNRTDIDADADIIWSLLAERGTLSYQERAELTGFHDRMLLLSLGWLAQEDKIVFHDNVLGLVCERY